MNITISHKNVVIPLTRGMATIVDPEDYDRLSKFKWYADENRNTFYAVRALRNKKIYMHREILNFPVGKLCDHKNKDGLDNRKSNLRIVDHIVNGQNRRAKKGCASGITGVSIHRRNKRWVANIQHNGKTLHLGYFIDKAKAAIARKIAERKYYGSLGTVGAEIYSVQ